jgi:inosose dehydratase
MICSRRQWLASAAALPAFAAKQYKPLLGVQLYVWQQQFGREKKTIAEGVAEAIPAVARAGYSRVEMTSAFWTPEVRDKTRALLKQHRLEMPIIYNGGPMHTPEGAAKTIAETLAYADVARAAGARAVSFNANPKKERKTDEELAVQAGALDELGGKLRARKMDLLIHQHAPELQENAREWRWQFRHTDPKLVKICLDIDWVKRAGQDVMTLLRESAPRLAALHLRSARNGVWMEELADGDVDYREVAAYLRETGFAGWVTVELAYEKATVVTRPLEENLRRSREYAERIFL